MRVSGARGGWLVEPTRCFLQSEHPRPRPCLQAAGGHVVMLAGGDGGGALGHSRQAGVEGGCMAGEGGGHGREAAARQVWAMVHRMVSSANDFPGNAE